MTTNAMSPGDPEPAAVYALVGRLVLRLNALASNVRIAFDTPGGLVGVLPVAIPADGDEDTVETAIVGVCAAPARRPAPGKAIAAEADREFDSYFRSALARLARDGRITKDGRGYGPPEAKS